MDSKEIWKDIDGYEGLYQVSNFGKVRSLDRIKPNNGGQIIKGGLKTISDNDNGYEFVNLWKDNKGKNEYVHRLVANAFIPNPHGLKYINHKDEVKSNNHVENLEWCTAKYNCNYGNRKKNFKMSYVKNGNNRPVDVYDMNGNFVRTYDCSNEACKELKVGRRELYLVCQGVSKSCKGYRFAFHGESLKPYEKRRGFSKVIHVFKYDINNNLISLYNSMREAERDNDMGRGYLRVHNIKHNGNIVKDGFRFVLTTN